MWNPPGDPFPVTLYASDVSGICSSGADVGGNGELNGPAEPRDDSVWQQCPNPVSWSFSVDTRSQVPTDWGLPNRSQRYERRRMVDTPRLKTVSVDNDPVGVSFRTPNDANPSVWVNHAVTVDATPTAGPSGVGGMNCSVDGAQRKVLHGQRRHRQWRRRPHRFLHRLEQRRRAPRPGQHRERTR